MKNFRKEIIQNITLLEQYVPIVDRVHGAHHPEFHDVRRVFEEINAKLKDTEVDKVELDKEFEQIRMITDNYRVPADVCESYEAVYNMLAQLDEAYYR